MKYKKFILTILLILIYNYSFAEKNNYFDIGLGTTKDDVPMISLYYGHKLTKLNDSITLNGEVNGSLILFSYRQFSQTITSNITLSAVPMFNFALTKNFSIDAGIGLSYMVNRIVSIEPLNYRDSNINFSINTGLKYDIGNFNIMGRYQHLSNAGLTYNNYGLNTYNLIIGINF